MECNQMKELISAYADGELDAQQRAQAERHLGECENCSQSLKAISAMKVAMRNDVLLFNVPGALRKKIESMVAKAADPPAHAKPKTSRPVIHLKHVLMATAAGLALAAGITGYVMWPTARDRIEAQAVQDYRQALAGSSVAHVESSDSATVLHWLSMQSNFSPVTPNRLPTGYTLAGGRIDVVDGRHVAVFVYRKGSQTSNLFQWPANNAVGAGNVDTIQGVGVTAWNAGGMNFVMVSDGGAPAVGEMADLVITQGCGPR
jgi:anti-sigma factor RsiW